MILHRKVQEAICQEIKDAVSGLLSTYTGAADKNDEIWQSVCYVAEFTCRNLYMRGLIEKEHAVQVFEATGGDMDDIENWTLECEPGCGHTKRPPVQIDSLMPESFVEHANSIGVCTSLPVFRMAWVEDGKVRLSSFTNPEHAQHLLGIIERNREKEMKAEDIEYSDE